MLEIRPVTIRNWRELSNLKVRDDQSKFVSSNLQSIAEMQFGFDDKPGYGRWQASSFGIYDGDTPVGFFLLGRNPQNPEVQGYVIRLMVDEKFQGRGYGKFAMGWILEMFKEDSQVSNLAISYEPDNEIARALYASFGFSETGEIEDGEVVAKLNIRMSGTESKAAQ